MKQVKHKEMFIVRAKSVDTNEWVYGNVLFFASKGFVISESNAETAITLSDLNEYLTEIDISTLDRNIGEYDLNGKMIFENDIISEKVIDPDPDEPKYAYYLIKWVAEYDQFMAVPIEGGRLIENPNCDSDSMLAVRHTEYHVVGNIHDNKIEDY